ncbi:YceI family protein [Paucibacter sp. APW11]|uniref:YceI family protein n=1 Tax=Roseateles aquae TaxID=3077235 RepID=A0ABU3PH38_9BURK|nr:YceI family protein [Paucibacter sp. APW11]MDT9001848.1 YceI family protein [Paucibacter sp. APW11]
MMTKTLIAASVLAGLLLAGPATAAPQTYTIVSKLSRVSFNLEHQGFIQLFGTLRLAPGNFVFDAEDWSQSSVAVKMPIPSLDMGDAVWNQQIRGDSAWKALFSRAEIGFRSTKLEQTGPQQGLLHGELSLAGVTKPVTLQLRFNKLGLNQVSEKPSVGFAATTTIKRSDFGLDAYADLVGDALAVNIQLEAAVGADGDAGHATTALGVKPMGGMADQMGKGGKAGSSH